MNDTDVTEMGPIDYILIEWRDTAPTGEALPLLMDLVERGTIRILDIALIAKDEDGNAASVGAGDEAAMAAFEELLGAASGMLDQGDLEEAAEALEPGTIAALLVFENSWAAPFATAIRRNGGQLVASGRIPIQSVVAALDAAERRLTREARR